MEENKLETKNLNNLTMAQLKHDISSSRCRWMGDDLCILDVRYKDGLHLFRHPYRFDAYMMMFCVKGHIRLNVNLNEFDMDDGTLFLSAPGNILKVNEVVSSSVEDLHYAGILMSKTVVHNLRVDINKLFNDGVAMIDNPCLKLSQEEGVIAGGYLELMAKVLDVESNFKMDAVSSLVSSLFYLFAGVHSRRLREINAVTPSSTSRGRQVFDQFIKLVSENYSKYRNVGFYADCLCLTPKYLSKLIKSTTGRSAPEWIDAYVILEAKNLLKFSSSTIKEIVYMLNFPNQSVFYKFFKARTGMTPSEYRNS
ncbi:MAG: helix-turn-helix domain-containing protein [Candidatus Cryptobacteroides sp.]